MAEVGRWRAKAGPIIRRVLQETQGQEEDAVRKALHDAYPFGQRAMHPYKAWRDEIKRQRGTYQSAGARKRAVKEARLMAEVGQGSLSLL